MASTISITLGLALWYKLGTNYHPLTAEVKQRTLQLPIAWWLKDM